MISMCQTQSAAIKCSLCKQTMFEYGEEDLDVAFFGAADYACCPACKRCTKEKMSDEKWRRKVDKFIEKICKKQSREKCQY
jgi:hypothetical protein